MELNNNTVLITGGGSGIGLALAKALAAFGNKIIVCGRDPAKLATMQQENPVIESIQCDITRDGDQQKLIEHIQLKYPKLKRQHFPGA